MKLLSFLLLSSSLLQAVSPVKEITTLKEYKEVVAQDKPLVLFFYAPWCAACKGMKDPFDEVAQELKDKALLVKINIENKELKPISESLGITAIPTIFIRKVGRQDKIQLKNTIEAATAKP